MSGLPRRSMRRLAHASMLACDHFVGRRYAARRWRPFTPGLGDAFGSRS
jgi:hypothetical protein